MTRKSLMSKQRPQSESRPPDQGSLSVPRRLRATLLPWCARGFGLASHSGFKILGAGLRAYNLNLRLRLGCMLQKITFNQFALLNQGLPQLEDMASSRQTAGELERLYRDPFKFLLASVQCFRLVRYPSLPAILIPANHWSCQLRMMDNLPVRCQAAGPRLTWTGSFRGRWAVY